ncbi:MAG TPA: hypothetical protein PKK10_16445 [Woeseiaceae bacterium]|nr:hypothetical protein [Woeseiaceae bacterium]
MNFQTCSRRLALLVSISLSLFSLPALAVVNQSVEFPDAQDVRSVTLVIDGDDTVHEAEIKDEEDSRKAVFVLPDGSEGKSAVLHAEIDGEKKSYELRITALPFVIGAASVAVLPASPGVTGFGSATDNSAWIIVGTIAGGLVNSGFLEDIANQSSADASDLLSTLGVTGITSFADADDNAFASGLSLGFGWQFADESRLWLDYDAKFVSDMKMSAGADGNVPMSASMIDAESVGKAETNIQSFRIGYSRWFSPTSQFGYRLALGSVSVESDLSFMSTIRVDGSDVDSFSGEDTLDDNGVIYGAGLEWAPRNSRMPDLRAGVMYEQISKLNAFDDNKMWALTAYVSVGLRLGSRRQP